MKFSKQDTVAVWLDVTSTLLGTKIKVSNQTSRWKGKEK